MKFEVKYPASTNRPGKVEILNEDKLPTFSPTFNSMVLKLKIGEEMYEMSDMVTIKRVE